MAMTDPIADMLVRIKNAIKMKHEKVNIPSSKIKINIASILKEQGFIRNFKEIKDRKQGMLRIYLKYGKDNSNVIQGVKRISSPGRRVYVGADDIPVVFGGVGVVIISTNQGILVDKACAERKIGGEVICSVW